MFSMLSKQHQVSTEWDNGLAFKTYEVIIWINGIKIHYGMLY